MDHNHGSSAGSGAKPEPLKCKISMLWNWNTVDSCFIARSWRITTPGMFAGSCIGVVLLVVGLEMIRRAVKEWDRYLIRVHRAQYSKSSDSDACDSVPPFRPNLWQQAVRSLLHMVQFAVAYFIMLLAMYYNGYIIFSIFIGAFIGAMIFQWETLNASGTGNTTAAKEATVCCG